MAFTHYAMHAVTLYRITKEYAVSQCYRMSTEVDIRVPQDYMLKGVSVHEDFEEWVGDTIVPVIEQHNGDSIIDEWAVPESSGIDHLTITVVANCTIIIPDLLHNTTTWKSTRFHHLLINQRIHSAICAFERKHIVLPPFE